MLVLVGQDGTTGAPIRRGGLGGGGLVVEAHGVGGAAPSCFLVRAEQLLALTLRHYVGLGLGARSCDSG